MIRYKKCKMCRRAGIKLFLKGEKCYKKCTLDKRKTPPGQQSSRVLSPKSSIYGKRLMEKQRLKWMANITETQLKNYLKKAQKMSGLTGENLLRLLELRLDNVIYRLGLAPSRRTARQFIVHGHVILNNKKVRSPALQVKPNDVITFKDQLKNNKIVIDTLEAMAGNIPSWLSFDRESFTGKVVSIPMKEEFSFNVDPRLIIEFYS